MSEARRTRAISLLPLAAALVTVVLWASAFVGIRDAGRDLSPGSLVLGRLLVGSVVLGVVALLRAGRWPQRGDWPRLLLYGVLWFGVYNLTLNAAERRVDAGTAAMLVNIGPVLIAVFAGLVLGEGFPRNLFAGSAVAFAGVVVIGASTASRASADGLGVLLCIAAAVAYSVAVVTQKPLLRRLSAVHITWLACTIGAVVCLPFAPDLVRELRSARPVTFAWLVYLGALPTALAFTLWAYALARTTAGRLSAMTYLVPPLAILMGWALLHEIPAPLAFAGGALCFSGVALTRRRPPAAPSSVPEAVPATPVPVVTAD